jgi:hypothetical protein
VERDDFSEETIPAADARSVIERLPANPKRRERSSC